MTGMPWISRIYILAKAMAKALRLILIRQTSAPSRVPMTPESRARISVVPRPSRSIFQRSSRMKLLTKPSRIRLTNCDARETDSVSGGFFTTMKRSLEATGSVILNCFSRSSVMYMVSAMRS